MASPVTIEYLHNPPHSTIIRCYFTIKELSFAVKNKQQIARFLSGASGNTALKNSQKNLSMQLERSSPIGRKTQAREAKDHHGPGGGFRDRGR